MLKDSDIKEFQKIYKNVFGVEIDKKTAAKEGARLFRLFQILYQKPDNPEEIIPVNKSTGMSRSKT